ncbi:LacI family DNA-binding transcriptional regulator [Microbacterium aquimaris]|uniref:LacI family DNA-binding transcriptional regulator n=1 Tax=Microbacterium aquimaris TaxID=459816 RepID=A0ABU5N7L9_9MICO|nr:LacI family DNA-binding transcriptional regulator [Microbacterium aquimaris]MDZ8162052.1 LacI family DNA-binding transcriptional regulator [Microbacterium aquimaris]
MSRAPRLQDVAAVAGVSVSLVSSFINTPHKVGKQSAERIAKAIEELKFVPNDAARQLRRGGSRMVAFVAYDIADPNFSRIAQGAQARAAAAGLQLVLADTSGQVETERAYIAMFEEQRVRGVLLSPAQHPEEYLESLETRGIPAVLVDHRPPSQNCSAVRFDNHQGGVLASSHLLGAGRRRLVVVGGDRAIPQVGERLRGAAEVVATFSGAQMRFVPTATRGVAAGRESAGEILAAGPMPDAVLCINDLIAIGLMQELTAAGVRIPDDVAVVGYNNIASEVSNVTDLSSIEHPHRALGGSAVELLLDELEGRSSTESRQIVFPPSLVVRGSSTSSPTETA